MNDFLQSLRGGQKDKRTQKTRRSFDNGHHYNSSSNYHNNGGYSNSRNGNFKRSPRQAPPNPEEGTPLLSSEVVENFTSMIKSLTRTQESLVEVQERRVMAEERKADALEEIAEYLSYVAMPSYQDEDPCLDDEQFQSPQGDVDACGAGDCGPGVEEVAVAEIETPVVEEQPRKIKTRGPGRPKGSAKRGPGRPRKTASLDEEQNRTTAGPGRPRKDEKQVRVLKRTRAQKQDRAEAKDSQSKSLVQEGPLSRAEAMETIERMRSEGATFDQIAKYFMKIGQPTFSGRGEWHAQTVHRLCNR